MKIIVLEIFDYKDDDVIINGISQNGPVSFKVRGAKKPNSAFKWLNSPLVIADVEYVENVRYRHQILKNAQLIHYPLADTTPSSIAGCAVASEAVLRMLQDDERHLIFDELEKYVTAVKNYKDPGLAALIFLGKMVALAGFSLEVNKCIYCGNTKNIVAFSFAEGGFICRDCLKNEIILDLNPNQMRLMRSIINANTYLNLPNDKISKEDKKALLMKFKTYIQDGIGVELHGINLVLQNY